jgi:hypothetical protein
VYGFGDHLQPNDTGYATMANFTNSGEAKAGLALAANMTIASVMPTQQDCAQNQRYEEPTVASSIHIALA